MITGWQIFKAFKVPGRHQNKTQIFMSVQHLAALSLRDLQPAYSAPQKILTGYFGTQMGTECI